MNIGQNPPGSGQSDYQDFVNRYQQGHPAEGYTEQEALDQYQRVAPQLPPQDYQQAARDAFARMSPQERVQFGQYLAQQARQQGYPVPDLNRDGVDDRLQDPNYLAQVTGQMQQQQPGLLNQLLGGGGPAAGGNLLSHPLAKVALGGIAAYGLTRVMGSGGALSGQSGLGSFFGGGERQGGFADRREGRRREDDDDDDDDDD